MLRFLLITILVSISNSQDTGKQLVTLPSGPTKDVKIGGNYFVECVGQNFSDVEKKLLTDLKWKKNNVEIEEGKYESDIYTEKGQGQISLFIKNIKSEYGGEYVCEGKFAGNIDLRTSQVLNVQKDITWTECAQNQPVVLGEAGFIQCIVQANPQAATQWKDKDSNNINSNDKYNVKADGLVIQNVSLADGGTYQIQAKVSETGSFKSRKITVEVHVPPTITNPPKNTVAVEGREAKMSCIATGVPKPTIKWLNKERTDLKNMPDDYTVDEKSGDLIIKSPRKDQEGEYTCEADNSAGRREAKTKLTVIIMPKIEKFENKTVDQEGTAELECFSSGNPAPKITITKVGSDYSMDSGRINSVTSDTDENGWTSHKITIANVKRNDDGLYSCLAENQGGRNEKKGHLTVQFSPVMTQTPSTEVITWQGNPVNITCVAESIPNATIKWWYRSRVINSDENAFQVFGTGPVSVLNIKEPRQDLYETYTCKAANTIGENEIRINLKEVYKPGRLYGVVTKTVTATTITFRIEGPTGDVSADVTGYICRYKDEESTEWKIKKWSSGSDSYILSGLIPEKRYEFKFAAQNVVGIGEFIDVKSVIMPRRSAPEIPEILRSQGNKVIYTPYQNKFNIQWRVPPNNGEEITAFHINYYKVKNESNEWKKKSDFNLKNIKVDHDGRNAYQLTDLSPETFYKVELSATNAIGNSPSTYVIFKTAKDDGTGKSLGELNSPSQKRDSAQSLKPAEIIGIIVGILVIILIILDISFCLMKKCGLTLFICTKLQGEDKSDEKSKEFIEDGKLSEKEPLRNGEHIQDEKTTEDATMLKGEKAKENEGMDINSTDSDIKPPKDSAV